MMKNVFAAAAIVAFGATSAAAADCGWKAKQDTIAGLDMKTEQQQTAKQSTPAAAAKTGDRTAETARTGARLQVAVDPRTDDVTSE